MNDVVKYLQECGTFYLATVEGDQPHVHTYTCPHTRGDDPVWA